MSSFPLNPKGTAVVRLRKLRAVRKRSMEEREHLLALFARSGQTQKRFCRENDLPLSTLTYWRRRARQSARTPLEGVLVEVPSSVAGKATVAALGPPQPKAVEIRLPNRIEVSVAAGTDSVWLGELLRRLLTCSG
jgi:transposase-like protein